jgi:hypothetical protein
VPESIPLPDAESLALLRGGVFGRMAVTAPDGPHVVPVNYAVVDDAVVVRTEPGSVLGTHAPGGVAAFEVDHVDYETRHGWSVVVRGAVEMVVDPVALHRIATTWPPRPWAVGERPLHLRLTWHEIHGRRIGAGWSTLASLPVRRAP